MPVTTATRLEDLAARPDLLPEGLRFSAGSERPQRGRHRKLSAAALWGAAGLVLLAAIALVVASMQ
jgi:hypothetical protein